MIALVFAMLAARKAQAVAVLLLSLFATGAAVAGPTYLGAVDRAVVRTEVGESDRMEQTISVSAFVGDREAVTAQGFDSVVPRTLDVDGFEAVYSTTYLVLGVEPDPAVSWLVFRSDVCPHLRMVAGRCLMAAGETVVGESTARRLGLGPGSTVTVTAATYSEMARRFVPAGAPAQLAVVGVYQPLDAAAVYWGRTGYFALGSPDSEREPLFVNRQSADGVDHPQDMRTVEGVPGPGALDADHLDEVRADLADLREELTGGSGGGSSAFFAQLTTELDGLLDRVDRAQALARRVVPVAAVPLVGLCWFVIFLAVAYGTAGRRHELGLVALRGARRPVRWWLGAGESTLAILAGAPLGYLAGTLAVWLVARARFGGGELALSGDALPYAALAAAGALLAALLAQRQQLASPVAELLRRVPARTATWRTTALEAIAVALAVVAVFQLRGFEGELVGLSLLVPSLVAVAIALVAARLLMPLAGRLGARALRRGRLGPALGALHVSRRPGSHRLFVLLAVAVSLLGFAAMAVDVASRSRAERASVETGADRVLTVLPVDAGKLLAAVREVDPDGRYAMAAAVVPPATPAGRPMLAVDSTRLERVAVWRPEFGPSPGEVTRLLRPATAEPYVLRGTRVTAVLDNPGQPEGQLRLAVSLRPLDGGATVRMTFGVLDRGVHTYTAEVGPCAAGCRLLGFDAIYARSGSEKTSMVIRELPGLVSTEQLAAGGWKGTSAGDVTAGPEGLAVSATATGARQETWVLPPDVPTPLPVVTAGALPDSVALTGLDADRPVPLVAGEATTLPRLGARGVLTDLEYLERQALGGTRLTQPQVWLRPDAPPGVTGRLAEQGLVIADDDTVAGARALLDERAPALAIWFHLLAAGFAVLLGLGGLALMAAVDRRRTTEDMRALRLQGLPARAVGRAALWSYLPVVVAALVTGAVAAVVAWWLAGGYLPVFVDDSLVLELPRWPSPSAAALPALLAALGFAAAAVGVSVALRRSVSRPTQG
ncbi:ABC transporter permease family protein [Phytohabitans suffuscus]